MQRVVRPAAGWVGAVLIVVAVLGGLSVRDRARLDATASPSPGPSAALTSLAPDAAVAGAWDLIVPFLPVPRATATPTPRPTPSPTPTPTAPPTPVPAATPAPVAAAPTPPPDRSGGGLAPRTPPPGWTPPATIPGDVWTSGTFGQTLSSGGITVTAARLPLDIDSSACDDGNPDPAGYVRVGFRVTTTWSGFPIPVYSADAPNQGPSTCWLGSPAPLVSGVAYEVFLWLPPEQAATSVLRTGYFPNGSSPAYIFEFR